MDFSIKLLALYSPIFVSLVWGITLYFKNYKIKKPGYYMSLVQFSALAIFISLVPFYHQNPILSSQMDAFFYGGLLSIFPFIYFYIRHIATKEKIELKQFYFHLAPAIVFAFVGLFIPLILSKEDLNIYALSLPFDKKLHWAVFFFKIVERISTLVLIMQSILYLYLMSNLIKEYKNRVNNYFSNISNPHFNWIHVFYIVFIISLFAAIPPLIAGNTYMAKNGNHLLTICFFTLSIVFFLIAFIADNHQYIIDESFYVQEEITTGEQSTLASQKNLESKIKKYFEQEKPYLQGNLKITDVARALATNRTYISEIIKTVYYSNFSDYVNTYRIEEAKILLTDTNCSNLTIAEICDKAGFNTYNSFIKAFKKKYKCTPNEYRRKMQNFWDYPINCV